MRHLSLTFVLLCLTLSTLHASDTLQARTHLSRALSLLDSARFGQVQTEARQALSIFQKQNPVNNLAIADCQNAIGRAWLGLEKPDSALVYFQKALTQRQRILGEQHPSTANCYNNLGIAWSESGDLKQAFFFHQKALDIRLAVLGECHPDAATSYHNMGNCLYLSGDYRQALENYQRALVIRLDAFGQKHHLIAQSCTAIANCLMQQGDSYQAVFYFEKALATGEDVFGKNNPRLADTYTSLGSLELDLGRFTKARQHLLAALKISRESSPATAPLLDKLGLSWQQEGKYDMAQQYHENALALQLEARQGEEALTGSIYANLGACLLRKKQPEEALKNFQKARAIFEKTNGRRHPATGQCVMNAGICYFEKDESGSALEHFERALAIFKKTETTSHSLMAACHHHIGQVWQRRGDTARALASFEKALRISGYHTGQPFGSELSEELLPALAARAGALLQLARSSSSLPSLLDARNAHSLALQALAALTESSGDAGARQKLTEHHYPIFEGAIETHFLLWEKTDEKRWLERAFQLSERSRSFSQLETTPETPVSVAGLQTGLLDERTALIEWFVGSDQIFTLLITKDTLLGFHQKHDFPLREWVSAVRRGIYFHYNQGAETSTERQQEYLHHARLLWQKLLQGPLDVLPANISRLILIPDGALHYLPFDALPVDMPAADTPFHAWPYLLKKYAVSYGISAAQLLELKKSPGGPARYSLLAVAPDFQHDSRGLKPLRFNRREAAAAVNIWGGKLLEGNNATRQNFLEPVSGYTILLLSTHGNADAEYGETSWLAFTEIPDSLDNESLSAGSLSRLHLPAELVVLSACETGIGEYRPGEGVAGLANAFAAAGARSVLTTLWAVDDAATAEITEAFFQHLKAGMPKDLALQKARLDYLDAHPDGYGHPFFWAAFAMRGEVEGIAISPKDHLFRTFWLVLAVAVFAILYELQRWGKMRRI